MRPFASILIYFSLISVLLGACRSLGPDLPPPLSGSKALIVGHGGRGFTSFRNGIPANSFASMIRAIEAEHADGIEMDVQLSGDSIPILFHEDFLERSTNCKGCSGDYTFAELQKCAYKNSLEAKLHNYPLASLEEVMAYFADDTVPPLFSLNIKIGNACTFTQGETYRKTLAAKTVALVAKYNAWDWVLVECPAIDFLLEIRNLDAKITIMVDGDVFPDDFDRVVDNDLDGIVARVQSFSKEEVAAFHAEGREVVMYGIQLRKDAIEALEKGADQLQVEDIRMVKEVLKGL